MMIPSSAVSASTCTKSQQAFHYQHLFILHQKRSSTSTCTLLLQLVLLDLLVELIKPLFNITLCVVDKFASIVIHGAKAMGLSQINFKFQPVHAGGFHITVIGEGTSGGIVVTTVILIRIIIGNLQIKMHLYL